MLPSWLAGWLLTCTCGKWMRCVLSCLRTTLQMRCALQRLKPFKALSAARDLRIPGQGAAAVALPRQGHMSDTLSRFFLWSCNGCTGNPHCSSNIFCQIQTLTLSGAGVESGKGNHQSATRTGRQPCSTGLWAGMRTTPPTQERNCWTIGHLRSIALPSFNGIDCSYKTLHQ